MPKMKIMIVDAMSAVRMFRRASLRSMGGSGSYSLASTTIAQNSSAR